MMACVLAAGMSSGSAIQVTVAGLISQNLYQPYLRPGAEEEHYVLVTKIVGVAIIGGAMIVAILMRASVVETILDFFNLTASIGIAVGMGILWRRMNTAGVFASALTACAVLLVGRTTGVQDGVLVLGRGLAAGLRTWELNAGCVQTLSELGFLGGSGANLTCTRMTTIALPLALGLLAGIVGSLFGKPPAPEAIEKFFCKIYTPIGQEDRLNLPLDQVVPSDRRLITAGGLFIVKPSRQSWVGFVVTLGICLALVGLMLLLLG
jgi:Na+/proline symporter